MADEQMNAGGTQGQSPSPKGGSSKVWGWIVLIIIILLILWGLFALGDDNTVDEGDTPNTEESDTLDAMEEDLENTDLEDVDDGVDDIEAEVDAEAGADTQ